MRRLKVAIAATLAAGIVSVIAAPATADPLPCKIFIRGAYIANNPLCYIHP